MKNTAEKRLVQELLAHAGVEIDGHEGDREPLLGLPGIGNPRVERRPFTLPLLPSHHSNPFSS